MIDRRGLINALQRMPDEAFMWVAVALASHVFEGELGAFSPLARAAIEWVRDEARRWIERHRSDAQSRG